MIVLKITLLLYAYFFGFIGLVYVINKTVNKFEKRNKKRGVKNERIGNIKQYRNRK